jgi:exopolysaccharide biosynthesis predicted pyruvyltransferase EpsI
MTGEPRSVAELESLALSTLETVVPRGSSVAFVNFPNHGNPGDSAIWLGTQRLLAQLEVKIAYSAAWWSLDISRLAAVLPADGMVLLNGGGNFGDVYLGQQAPRERLLRELTTHRIVQMPQSIWFEEQGNIDRMRELIRAHGAFDLLVRDRSSFTIASEQLDLVPTLSPDHAFGLGSRQRSVPIRPGILWNSWGPSAPEFRAESAPPTGATGLTHIDWIEGADSVRTSGTARDRRAFALNARYYDRVSAGGSLFPRDQRRLSRTFEPMARQWTDRGFAVIGSARVVVTNKLHGHIFCLLSGIPHVVLDNSYGKVFHAVETWTRGAPGVHVAGTADEAYDIATRLMLEVGDE